jgi:hypothetical protein
MIDTDGSCQPAQKIAPNQLNNQQNESPTYSPLCTGMNYSGVDEFGTADFTALSFSLGKKKHTAYIFKIMS